MRNSLREIEWQTVIEKLKEFALEWEKEFEKGWVSEGKCAIL